MTHETDETRFEQLTEHVSDWRGGDAAVDASLRLVRNIALTGLQSKNGYRYSEQSLRDAVLLYESKPVFLDHASNLSRPYERSTRDLVGSIASPRYHEGRIRADIQVLDTDAGRTFLALAQTKSPTVGMSHVVLAERSVDQTVVQKIHDVVSVDAVVFPATTSTFQESIDCDPADDGVDTSRHADCESALAELTAQIERVTSERDALRVRLEDIESQQAMTHRREEIERLLAGSRLPSCAVTELFRSQLLAAEPAARRALIRERQLVLEQLARHGPVSRERSGGDRGPSDAAVIAAIRGASAASAVQASA